MDGNGQGCSSIHFLLSGSDLNPEQYNSSSDGIPYMTGASNISNGHLVVNRWTPVPKNISVLGDLLITCKGTVGLTAFNGIGDLHIARQFMAIRNFDADGSINLRYLQAFLMSRARETSDESTGLIPGIDRSTLLGFLVPIPPVIEQNRIVAALDNHLPLFEIDNQGEAVYNTDD